MVSTGKAVVLASGIFFLTAGWGAASGKEENPGKAIFEKSCAKCHNLERAKTKKKTRDEWETTVLRMKKNGAAIGDEDVKLIVDYLAATYKK